MFNSYTTLINLFTKRKYNFKHEKYCKVAINCKLFYGSLKQNRN